jgi:penicillin-binding protein 1C
VKQIVFSKIKKWGFKFFKWTGICLLGLVILFFILNWIFPLRSNIEYATVVTDSKGEVINAFLTSDQQWRMKTELSEISPLLQKTIIAKEDKYFYAHPGVNPFAVVRAFFRNIAGHHTSGASTITMQVAKMLEPGKRNLFTKIRQVFRAFQLELKYSKKKYYNFI